MRHKLIYHKSVNPHIGVIICSGISGGVGRLNIKFENDWVACSDGKRYAMSKNSHFDLFWLVFDIQW